MQSDPIIPKSWTVDSKYTDWFNAIRYVSVYKVEEKRGEWIEGNIDMYVND